MLKLLKTFQHDEHGVILSAEIVLLGTLLVLGLLTGMACLQQSVNSELGDFARAIDRLDQSYSFAGCRSAGLFGGISGCRPFTSGSSFMDNAGYTNVSDNAIVGSEGQMMLQSALAGVCGSCGGEGHASGVCGACGTLGDGSANPPESVATGVPKMKVTEYPGTSNVPHTIHERQSALRFPQLEAGQDVRAQQHEVPPGVEQPESIIDAHPPQTAPQP